MPGISDLRGRWKLVENNGFDAYLKHLGVSWLLRNAASLLKPVLTISSSDLKHWTINSHSTFKSHTTEFDIGTEFNYETMDGRKMMVGRKAAFADIHTQRPILTFPTLQTKFTIEGDKLVQMERRIKPEDKDSKIVRYVAADNKLHIDMESDNVRATRIYERST